MHEVCRGVGRRRKRDVTLVIIVACMHVVLIIIDDVDLYDAKTVEKDTFVYVSI